jgi:apolipoprotein N-acyltransferase
MERLANRIMLLTGWRRAGIAFAVGALTVLAQAPFHLFVVCFLTFPVLVWLLDGAIAEPTRSRIARSRPPFAVGWMFGFGYFVAGLWWIGNALFVEAEEFIWLWPFAILALPALLALFFGLATAIARMLWSDGIGRIAALAFAFGLLEWLRSFVFTGFPWNAIGYAAMPVPILMQPASAIGVFGMNAAAVFAFSLPALFSKGRAYVAVAATLLVALIGADAGYGYWRLTENPAQEEYGAVVRVIQPAVDQSRKAQGTDPDAVFADLLELTASDGDLGSGPDIVVWPETSVPFILTERPDAIAAIADTLDEGQVLLAGAIRVSETETRNDRAAYFNSILAIDGDGVIFDAADKKHLVPFGEYLPFGELLGRAGISAVAAADRGYSAAVRRRTLSLPGDVVVMPSICYEAIFPGETSAEGDPANVIVNVTNDAWYGDTPGPYQHVHQSRIRAVESGLPLVRAANNGVSAIFDGTGRQLASLGYGPSGAIEAVLPASLKPTVYTRQGRLVFAVILAALFVFAFGVRILGGKRLKSHRLP